jgi:hypothetical protein
MESLSMDRIMENMSKKEIIHGSYMYVKNGLGNGLCIEERGLCHTYLKN